MSVEEWYSPKILSYLRGYLLKEQKSLQVRRFQLGSAYDDIIKLQGYSKFNMFIHLYFPWLMDTLKEASNLLTRPKVKLIPALKEEAEVYQSLIKFSTPNLIEDILKEVGRGERTREDISFPTDSEAIILEETTRALDALDFKIGRNILMQNALDIYQRDKTFKLSNENRKLFKISQGLYELDVVLKIIEGEKTLPTKTYVYDLPPVLTGGVAAYMIADACEGSVLPRVIEERNLELLFKKIPSEGLKDYFSSAEEVKEKIKSFITQSKVSQICLARIKILRVSKVEGKVESYKIKMEKLLSSLSTLSYIT
ncbi:MAG: hypothetical protein QW040_01330 [Candidatus Aenigmatarchaeota archaeon]